MGHGTHFAWKGHDSKSLHSPTKLHNTLRCRNCRGDVIMLSRVKSTVCIVSHQTFATWSSSHSLNHQSTQPHNFKDKKLVEKKQIRTDWFQSHIGLFTWMRKSTAADIEFRFKQNNEKSLQSVRGMLQPPVRCRGMREFRNWGLLFRFLLMPLLHYCWINFKLQFAVAKITPFPGKFVCCASRYLQLTIMPFLRYVNAIIVCTKSISVTHYVFRSASPHFSAVLFWKILG